MEDHRADDLMQSISKPSMKTESLSLLDLPQPVLEDIVTSVRRTIQYDGYLGELRLVSRTSSRSESKTCKADLCPGRLNEAVLLRLGFQESPRDFFPWHCSSCPTQDQSCHKPSCMYVGGCNHMYARYRLQANIQMAKAKDPCHTGFYETLARALGLFREHPEREGALLAFARLQVNNTDFFRCASVNPIFADGPSIIFCEATLTVVKTVNRDWHNRNFAEHPSSHRSAWFWLRNLACFLGDIDLFDFYSSRAYLGDTAPAVLLMERQEFLITTAARSHLALFQHILCRMLPSQSTSLRPALLEACCSGSLEITNMILQACPAENVATTCAGSLSGRHGARRVSLNYPAAAEQVVKSCGEIPRLQLCMILSTQAELGASFVVRLLLGRYRNRTFCPHEPNMAVASFSALWSACVNGDIECVRILMQDGYFAKMGKEDIRGLGLGCMDAAVHANAFSICQALCEFLGIKTYSLCFQWLAGVDGSLEAMIHKLEINPSELNTKSFKSNEHTIGQLALSRATTLLRVENVRFLLERGFRLHHTCNFEPLVIEWRRKRANEQKFHEVQELLQQYGLAQLEVEL
jgi:hypothetical protein